jgi:hypothetical protein
VSGISAKADGKAKASAEVRFEAELKKLQTDSLIL